MRAEAEVSRTTSDTARAAARAELESVRAAARLEIDAARSKAAAEAEASAAEAAALVREQFSLRTAELSDALAEEHARASALAASLSAQRAQVTAAEAHNETLEAALRDARAAATVLEKEIADAQAATARAVADAEDKGRAALEAAEATAAAARAEADSAREAAAAATAAVEKAAADRVALDSTLACTSAALANATAEQSLLESALADANAALGEASAESASLRERLGDLQRELASIQSVGDDASSSLRAPFSPATADADASLLVAQLLSAATTLPARAAGDALIEKIAELRRRAESAEADAASARENAAVAHRVALAAGTPAAASAVASIRRAARESVSLPNFSLTLSLDGAPTPAARARLMQTPVGLFSPAPRGERLPPNTAGGGGGMAALAATNRALGEQVLSLQAVVDAQSRECARLAARVAASKIASDESVGGHKDLAAMLAAARAEADGARADASTARTNLRAASAEANAAQEALKTAMAVEVTLRAALDEVRDELRRAKEGASAAAVPVSVRTSAPISDIAASTVKAVPVSMAAATTRVLRRLRVLPSGAIDFHFRAADDANETPSSSTNSSILNESDLGGVASRRRSRTVEPPRAVSRSHAPARAASQPPAPILAPAAHHGGVGTAPSLPQFSRSSRADLDIPPRPFVQLPIHMQPALSAPAPADKCETESVLESEQLPHAGSPRLPALMTRSRATQQDFYASAAARSGAGGSGSSTRASTFSSPTKRTMSQKNSAASVALGRIVAGLTGGASSPVAPSPSARAPAPIAKALPAPVMPAPAPASEQPASASLVARLPPDAYAAVVAMQAGNTQAAIDLLPRIIALNDAAEAEIVEDVRRRRQPDAGLADYAEALKCTLRIVRAAMPPAPAPPTARANRNVRFADTRPVAIASATTDDAGPMTTLPAIAPRTSDTSGPFRRHLPSPQKAAPLEQLVSPEPASRFAPRRGAADTFNVAPFERVEPPQLAQQRPTTARAEAPRPVGLAAPSPGLLSASGLDDSGAWVDLGPT